MYIITDKALKKTYDCKDRDELYYQLESLNQKNREKHLTSMYSISQIGEAGGKILKEFELPYTVSTPEEFLADVSFLDVKKKRGWLQKEKQQHEEVTQDVQSWKAPIYKRGEGFLDIEDQESSQTQSEHYCPEKQMEDSDFPNTHHKDVSAAIANRRASNKEADRTEPVKQELKNTSDWHREQIAAMVDISNKEETEQSEWETEETEENSASTAVGDELSQQEQGEQEKKLSDFLTSYGTEGENLEPKKAETATREVARTNAYSSEPPQVLESFEVQTQQYKQTLRQKIQSNEGIVYDSTDEIERCRQRIQELETTIKVVERQNEKLKGLYYTLDEVS